MAKEKSLLTLPSPGINGSVPAVPEYVTLQLSDSYSQPEPEEPVVPLSHYLWILRSRKWSILGFVLACVFATIVVSSRLTPIYEATAVIDIDRQAPAGFIGQDAARMAPNDADQFLATQVKTIQSDSVLRPVAERFKLRDMGTSQLQGRLSASRIEKAPVVLKNLKVTRPPNHATAQAHPGTRIKNPDRATLPCQFIGIHRLEFSVHHRSGSV